MERKRIPMFGTFPSNVWKRIMNKERGWIFFDIDGTLLHARGSGREAFRVAFEKAFGWEQNVEHITFAGATDLDVLRTTCADRDEPLTPEMEKKFIECLGPALDQLLAQNPPTVFPNIGKILGILSKGWKSGINYNAVDSKGWKNVLKTALARPLGQTQYLDPGLKGSDPWKCALVTGNVESTAKLKVQHTGLLDYFDLGGSGFGCEHADRAEIARRALERAENPERTVLVGDTPEDIRAAKANGMISIAVATGGFDFQTLKNAGADHVFQNFKDVNRLLKVLNDV